MNQPYLIENDQTLSTEVRLNSNRAPKINIFCRDYRVYSFYLLISMAVLMVAVLFQGICALLSDQYYKSGESPLRDRIHELVGGSPPSWATSHLVNSLCAGFTIITVIRFTVFEDLKLSFAIFTRLFWCLSILYFIRGIAITVTTLPCPISTCVPLKADSILGALKLILGIITGDEYECTDLIISGHTLFMTSMCMTWVYYSRKSKFQISCACIMAMITYFMIDVSFFHYTIDIIFAVSLSIIVYMFYHLMVDLGAYCVRMKLENSFLGIHHPWLMHYTTMEYVSRIVARIEGLEYRLRAQNELMRQKKNDVINGLKFNTPEVQDSLSSGDVSTIESEDQYLISGKQKVFSKDEYFFKSYLGSGTAQYDNLKMIISYFVRN